MAKADSTTCTRRGDALVFQGALDRNAATVLWPQIHPHLDGLRVLDLTAVPNVDSAGLALLAELVERLQAQGVSPLLSGTPAGLAELRDAYRLGVSLEFPKANASSL